MKTFLAEFLGTFALVFAGTGAIIADHVSGGAVGNTGIGLVFGLVVMAMICVFGSTSGAHLNPAVTWALALAGRFPWRGVPVYLAAQFAGAFAASGLYHFLFPGNPTLGATLPSVGAGQAFVLETLLTGMLVFTILAVAGKDGGLQAAAIGAVVGLEAMFAGPFTGASMNPARSLAPAMVSGNFQFLWLYPTSALLGAALAVPLWTLLVNGQSPPVLAR